MIRPAVASDPEMPRTVQGPGPAAERPNTSGSPEISLKLLRPGSLLQGSSLKTSTQKSEGHHLIRKYLASGRLMAYILRRPKDFSTIILVSMLLIDVIRTYNATSLTVELPLYQEYKCL